MLLVVVGATGKQGSSVVEAALESKRPIAVRAVVRDVRSAKAAALADRVAEIVEAELDDEGTLRAAFEGADAVYCVTPGDTEWERETARARNMARAAHEAKLRHVVWSTQEDTRPLLDAAGSTIPVLGGRFRVPSYDAKAEADATFRELGVPTTFMRTSFYWESLFVPGVAPAPERGGGAVIRWPLGDAKLPGIAVADIGRCAVGVLVQGATYVGQTIGICGEQLAGAEMATAIRDVLGIDCRYEAVEPDEFHTAPATANMFRYKRDCERAHLGLRDAALSRSLNPRLRTFREWLAEGAAAAAFRRLLGS
jgi:uncharacterized protein YbjT (DUF2867 family)